MSISPPSDDDPTANGQEPTADQRGESFLGRQSWGLSHYLWIALAVTLALAFIPRGVRKTLEGMANQAEDWLPPSYAESADLQWFRDHFAGEAFVLISWDGCTLGNADQLGKLQAALAAVKDDQGWQWFPRIRSGPETLQELMNGPAGLSRTEGINRLEGALIGPPKLDADGESLGDASRTTCLLAYLDDRLTTKNLQMRRAVEKVRDLAHTELGVPLADIHLGGPPVDNITIDIEGEKTLLRLAGLSGLVGITLAYLCFRSRKLTAMVFWTAGASAGMSLALVYWFGGFERLVMGLDEPRLGQADAILMSMPAVVYVLALSGAIHLVNYYRDERLEHGAWGAVERAVRVAWAPCLLASFTTAVGLGSLGTSDILPIQKFGIFSAIGVMVASGLLFCIMPVFLHRFPPAAKHIEGRRERAATIGSGWWQPLARFVTKRHGITTAVCLAVMATVAVGLTKTRTSVQLLGLLDEGCDLIHDYAWLEDNLGNLVPMEVIVGLDENQFREPNEPAVNLEQDGEAARYRMTMYERAQLVRTLQHEVEQLGEVSRVLTAATFSAEPDEGQSVTGVAGTISRKLDESRGDLKEYLRREENAAGEATGRELWRVSAKVTALGDVDYGLFVTDLRAKVEPVMAAYELRDALVGQLAAKGTPLDRSKVCVLTSENDPENKRQPLDGSPEEHLYELLQSSAGVQLQAYPLDRYLTQDEAKQAVIRETLAKRFDAVVALQPAIAEKLAAADSPLEVTLLTTAEPAAERPAATELTTVYTGVVPVVYKTQRELLVSLRDSILWATVLIAGVMIFVLRSPAAGVASMIPNVFPIVMVFGALGWLGFKIDIGIMMTASVALGVAVDDTLHFVTWFGRGIRSGLDRRSATLQAYERCATAMTQTTLIGGLGLAVFAVSTFTPTQQFGTLMITMLATALVGDLILLPALLCGPLGRFFAPGAPATPREETSAEPEEVPSLKVAPSTVEDPIEAEPAQAVEPATAVETEPTPELPPEPKPTATSPLDEPMSAANAALRSKLQSFRRRPSSDPS